ncbi:hypothetical protein EBQ74_00365, partial [bacterium]|nr:hypothetical protein [bacterium]
MVNKILNYLSLYLILSGLGLSTFSLKAHAATELEQIQEIRKFFGLDQYSYQPNLSQIKIAVIDNGFEGYDAAKKQLPDSTEVVSAYPKEMISKYNLG